MSRSIIGLFSENSCDLSGRPSQLRTIAMSSIGNNFGLGGSGLNLAQMFFYNDTLFVPDICRSEGSVLSSICRKNSCY